MTEKRRRFSSEENTRILGQYFVDKEPTPRSRVVRATRYRESRRNVP